MRKFLFLLAFILTCKAGFSQCAISTIATGISPSCIMYANGGVTVSASGGIAPYTLHIGGFDTTFTTSVTVNNVPAFTNSYYVTDAIGCFWEDTLTIPVRNDLVAATITPVVTDETCPGNNDGSINITVTGPDAPYYTTFYAPEITVSMNELSPGTYTYEILSSTMQCSTFVATINAGTMANCGTITGTVFFDDNANCILDGTDFGMPQYAYLNIGPNNIHIPVDNSGVFSKNLPLGSYTLSDSIEYFAGATSSACAPFSFTISTPGQVINHDAGNSFSNNTCGLGITNNIISGCSLGCMASYVTTVTGGTPPYNYFGGNDTIANACFGHQLVTVMSGTCYETVSLYIDSIALTGATVTPLITPSTCDVYLPDGQIDLTVSGPNPPYVVQWENNSFITPHSNLSSGSYQSYVTDNSGACSSFTYNVSLNPSASCPGFSGKVYYDFNNNCMFDAGDMPTYYYPVQIDTNGYTASSCSFTDSLGNYRVYQPFNSFYIVLNSAFGSASSYEFALDTNCTGHYVFTTSSGTPVVNNLDFALQDNDYCGSGITYDLKADCGENGYKLSITNDSAAIIYVLDYYLGYAWYSYGLLNGAVFPPDSTIHLLVRNYITDCNEFLTITTGPTLVHVDSLLNFSITDEHCSFAYNGSINVTNLSGFSLHYEWSNGDTTSAITNVNSGAYTLQTIYGINTCSDTTLYVGLSDTSCPKITGLVFFDINNNCIYDAGIDSTGFNSCYTDQVIINGSPLTIVDPDGTFDFYCTPGTYNVSYGTTICYDSLGGYSFTDPCWHNVIVNVDTITMVSDTVYFPLNITVEPDVDVSCYAWGTVPGFNMTYFMQFNNNSTTTNGQLFCILDDSVTFVSSSIPVDYTSGDTLFWNIAGLSYGAYQSITVIAQVMPYVSLLGSTLTNYCGFISAIPEPILANNFCSSTNLVTGAYDPNEKLVSPSGIGPLGYIKQSDDRLTYRINFQNTGTAPAHDVVVLDTISANFDSSTLEIIEASHLYIISFTGNVCKFTFPDIMLPDSTSDEAGSHGHITYRIKLNDSIPELTPINNTAYIYFDFNPAIVTNTVTNTMNNTLNVQEQLVEIISNPFKVFPNPFSTHVNIINSESANKFDYTLMDITGKIIAAKNNLSGNELLSMENLERGAYILRIETAGNVFAFRLIKQ